MSDRQRNFISRLVAGLGKNIQGLRRLVSDTAQNGFLTSIVTAVIAFVGTLFYLFLGMQGKVWQYLVLAGLTLIFLVISVLSALQSRRGRAKQGIWLIIYGLSIYMALSPVFLTGLSVWYAVGVILAVFSTSLLTLPGSDAMRADLLGIGGAIGGLLLGSFFQQIQIQPHQALVYFLMVVVGILIVVFLTITILFFPVISVRVKITIAVFSAAVLSIVVLAFIYNYTMRTQLTGTVDNTLKLAAETTRANLDTYLDSLINTVNNGALTPSPRLFLSMDLEARKADLNASTYLFTLQTLYNAHSAVLLDINGNVVLSTSTQDPSLLPPYMGLVSDLDQTGIQASLEKGLPFLSTIYFPKDGDVPHFFVGSRIIDTTEQPLGLLMLSYPASKLQDIITDANYIAGPLSFAVLVDDNGMRIAQGVAPGSATFKLVSPLDAGVMQQLQSIGRLPAGPEEAISTNYTEFRSGLAKVINDPYFTTQELGTGNDLNYAATVHLTHQPWTVSYMQPASVILAPVNQSTRTTILVAVLVGGIATLGATLLAKVITDPILSLTRVAEEAEGGNFTIHAQVNSQDEIGTLSRAFNSMIDRLRQTLAGLEQRVTDRTKELASATELSEYRANRLRTVADVAHTLAAIQDPIKLLPLVAETISERFGYYHVGVFLKDKDEEYAVLQASNSEGGQQMLARGHRLKIGEVGLVGFVANSGEARIALDVGKDAVFFDNPDLPNTRSEIALPLKSGTQVMGVLDVQSTEEAAFTQEDIVLLSTLADQVAMSIVNARLFSETQRTVRELQIAQRQYLQQEWAKVVSERQYSGFQYLNGKIVPLALSAIPEVLPAAELSQEQSGFDIYSDLNLEKGGQENRNLLVPISLRGQVIGLIDLEGAGEGRAWSEEEMLLAKAVADQVGLALENARLLEVTQRRAERERLVSSITSKLRSSNDPQEILETAVMELKHALRVRSVQVRVPGIDKSKNGEGGV